MSFILVDVRTALSSTRGVTVKHLVQVRYIMYNRIFVVIPYVFHSGRFKDCFVIDAWCSGYARLLS